MIKGIIEFDRNEAERICKEYPDGEGKHYYRNRSLGVIANSKKIRTWLKNVPEFAEMFKEAEALRDAKLASDAKLESDAKLIFNQRVEEYHKEQEKEKENGTYKYSTQIYGSTKHHVFDPNGFVIMRHGVINFDRVYIDKSKITHVALKFIGEERGDAGDNYYLVDAKFNFIGGSTLEQEVLIDEEWCDNNRMF